MFVQRHWFFLRLVVAVDGGIFALGLPADLWLLILVAIGHTRRNTYFRIQQVKHCELFGI